MNATFGQADKIEEKLAWLANILPVLESEGKNGRHHRYFFGGYAHLCAAGGNR